MDSIGTSVIGTEKNVLFLLLLLTWIQQKCWQEMNGWWMECKCDVNTRYKAAATGGCKVALTLQQERPPRLLSASLRRTRNEDKFSFFWRCLRCDGNFKWTRPFFLPLARWKSSSPSQPASCQGRSCIRCVVFLSIFFHHGSPLLGIASEHMRIIKVSIIYQICLSVRRRARLNQAVALRQCGRSDPTAPEEVSVRAQPTHLSKSRDVPRTRQPVWYAGSERFWTAGRA